MEELDVGEEVALIGQDPLDIFGRTCVSFGVFLW
jgi:hypothetical protein